jgi:HlyD family secretion protein
MIAISRYLSGLKGGEEIVSARLKLSLKTLKDKMEVEKVDKSKLFTEVKK